MASLANSVKDGSNNLIGNWDDVKDYNSVIITMKSPIDASAYLQWANTARNRYPNDNDIIAEEHYSYSSSDAETNQWDHRGRWFRLIYKHAVETNATTFEDLSLNVETLYKVHATEQKMVQDGTDEVALAGEVGAGTYQMVYTDQSGALLASTQDGLTNRGEALFTHLADSSGTSLAHTIDSTPDRYSLFVGLRDNCNANITATETRDIYVHPTNTEGHSQAGTISVSGAFRGDSALYLAGADNCGTSWTTTRLAKDLALNATEGKNAVYVQLVDSSGEIIHRNNPLPCVQGKQSSGVLAFDLSVGVTEQFTTIPGGEDKAVSLYNVFTYNDGPVTIWTKFYDITNAEIEPTTSTGVEYIQSSWDDYDDGAQNFTGTFPELADGGRGSVTISGVYVDIQRGGAGGIDITITFSTSGDDSQKIGLYTPSAPTSGSSRSLYITNITVASADLNNTLRPGDVLTLKFMIGTTLIINNGVGEFGATDVMIPLQVTGSTASLLSLNNKVRYNIATPAGQTRDMVFPRGLKFDKGLKVRSTPEHFYDSSLAPGEDVLFLNGTLVQSEI